MSVTIRAIADAAKVSRGTVDKVVNHRPGVSPAVRARVQALADDLGYKPNLAGKSLAFQKNPLRIGVLLLNGSDPIFQEMHAGVRKIAQELGGFGIEVDCRIMAGTSVQEQVELLQALGATPLAALVLTPLDDPAVADELHRLVDRTGLPIITCNTDLPAVDKLCFVGQALKQSGRVAGDLIGKLLPRDGTVLVLSGLRKIKGHLDRLEGFRELLAEHYPGLRVLQVIHDIASDGDAYRELTAFLANHPAPSGIFLAGRGTAGVGRALRERGGAGIRLVCYDRIPETLALLRDGIIDFTITQDPFAQGYLPVKVLFEHLFHGTPPAGQNLFTRIEIVARENL
jgi:LacI family transcriptional regulator